MNAPQQDYAIINDDIGKFPSHVVWAGSSRIPEAPKDSLFESNSQPNNTASNNKDFYFSFYTPYREMAFSLGGGLLLHLKRKLEICIAKDSCAITVKDWDINCEFADFNRSVARLFLQLSCKSRAQNLNEIESQLWARILSYVDIKRYNHDSASLIYLQGRLISKSDGYIVKWFGRREDEKIRDDLIDSLRIVNENECFSCYGKFDYQDKIETITNLKFIEDPLEFDLDSIEI